MIDIGSKVKDREGRVGILVGFTQGTQPVVMFTDEVKIFTNISLLEEINKNSKGDNRR